MSGGQFCDHICKPDARMVCFAVRCCGRGQVHFRPALGCQGRLARPCRNKGGQAAHATQLSFGRRSALVRDWQYTVTPWQSK